MRLSSAIWSMIFWPPNDEGGMAWNNPEIGVEWPQLKGEYKGSVIHWKMVQH